jgi:signal transduction histidine kinase
MTVRLRLALTVFLTGLATALAVIVTVALAFQRFEHESIWQRGDSFLARVTQQHDDLLDQHQRNPEEFAAFLRNLLLYEPDSQLYLLAPDGTVLVSTGQARLAPDFRVTLAPVQEAARASASGQPRQAAYVMGDDPEFMNADAVVAARTLQRSTIRPRRADDTAAGYLYLVCRKPGLPAGRLQLLGASLVSPALVPVVAVILLISALAAWIIITVTRPLKVLSEEVATAARAGFTSLATVPAPSGGAADDEFNRLRGGFHALLATLRMQWDELRRLDTFRRESVSNLSHDLRSPLTATVACLETLQARWQTQPERLDRDEDQRLVQVALRNTRNAAGMVRSLGDLALLDEPEFKLHLTRLDVGEVLDDIALRFAQRASQAGVRLAFRQTGDAPPVAEVDIELFERAVANLLDNALKFTPSGKAIELLATRHPQGVRVTVADQGAGIPAADLPRLFDRLYQSRDSVAPATSDEGKGLGLAIVKRIAELHRGHVSVVSELGRGTTVTLELPAV